MHVSEYTTPQKVSQKMNSNNNHGQGETAHYPSTCYHTPLSSSTQKDKEKGIMSVPDMTLFNPRGMVSPGGKYRRQRRSGSNKKKSARRAGVCDWYASGSGCSQSKKRRSGASPRVGASPRASPRQQQRLEGTALDDQGCRRSRSFRDQAEAIRVTKNRAKQAMKLFFHIQKKNRRSKKLRTTPLKKKTKKQKTSLLSDVRPATPYHKSKGRGEQFQYQSLSASFSDTSVLERQLQGGLRIQMKAVPRDALFDEREVFYDNYIAKLYLKEAKYVLECWKPMTGEVISNFFERINEIFLVDQVGLIYVTMDDTNSCGGAIGGGESDVAIRYGNDFQTRQLCMVLSLCHLKNMGVAPVGSEQEQGQKESQGDDFPMPVQEGVLSEGGEAEGEQESRRRLVSTTGVEVMVHSSRSRSNSSGGGIGNGNSDGVSSSKVGKGGFRVAYGCYAVFAMLFLASLLRVMRTNPLDVTASWSFLYLLE